MGEVRMPALLSEFLVAFAALFVVVEPLGAVPLFTTLTRNRPSGEARAIARRASVVGAGVLGGFALAGHGLLSVLGVRIDAFRMAGGLLLLLTALDMLRAQASGCRCSPQEMNAAQGHEDLAVVPLAIPVLAGPGSMATVMMLMSRGAGLGSVVAVLAAVVAVFVASWAVLRSAERVAGWLGPSLLSVIQRVLGLVLAALSIQFVVEGGLNLLRGLSSLKG